MTFLKRLVPSLKKRIANLVWPHGWRLKSLNCSGLFLLNYRNFVDRQMAFYGRYEQEQLEFITNAMHRYDCALFLDIGANIGYYSVLIAKRRLASRVVAFEPDTRSLYQLGANILINKLIGAIEVVPKAVSAQTGHISFLPESENSTGQSHIGDGDGAVVVECTSIDDCIKITGQRVFVKVDVESHELDVVEGMKNLLATNEVFLQIESYRAQLAQLMLLMASMNFRNCHHIGNDYYFSNFADITAI